MNLGGTHDADEEVTKCDDVRNEEMLRKIGGAIEKFFATKSGAGEWEGCVRDRCPTSG